MEFEKLELVQSSESANIDLGDEIVMKSDRPHVRSTTEGAWRGCREFGNQIMVKPQDLNSAGMHCWHLREHVVRQVNISKQAYTSSIRDTHANSCSIPSKIVISNALLQRSSRLRN